jgi:hypothetical protein
MLWIRIRKDLNLFVGSGYVTPNFGSGSKTECNMSKNYKKEEYYNFDYFLVRDTGTVIKLSCLRKVPAPICFKMPLKDLEDLSSEGRVNI